MRVSRLTVAPDVPSSSGDVTAFLIHGAVPTLIDAPTVRPAFVAQVEAALEQAGDGPLRQLLVTHAHPDHIDGAAAIAARWPEARCARKVVQTHDASGGVAWEALVGEPVIQAGDDRLWVIETPGHAPDHLCFFDVAGSAMFAGDMVINGGSVMIPASHGGHMRSYLQSLRKVLELGPRRLYPSHGPEALQPASLLRGYLAHRLQRERQVLDALGEGLGDPDAIVARLYPAVMPALGSAARETVIAHLEKLGEDGMAVRAGTTWTLAAR